MYSLSKIKYKLNLVNVSTDLFLIYAYKFFYHHLFLSFSSRDREKKQLLLAIIGCQRSGTSLISRIFARDLNVSVYRESSNLTKKGTLRFKRFDDLQSIFKGNPAPIIVFKALVETQNILEMFNYFPELKALWMFRNYKDVVNSNLKRFGHEVGIRNLRSILEEDKQISFSEKVSDYVHSTVSHFFSENMNPDDAVALLWFARNQLFYDLCLDKNPRVFMCRYEDLTAQPNEMIRKIYEFVGFRFINDGKVNEVHSESVNLGSTIHLSPQIEQLCDALSRKLNCTYQIQLQK